MPRTIAFPATGPDPDVPMDTRFGRARYFLFTPDEGQSWELVENPKADAPQGAGSGTAGFLAERGATDVCAVRFGPTAAQSLEALGVRSWWAPEGLTPRQALQRLLADELQHGVANAVPHHTHEGEEPAPPPPAPGPRTLAFPADSEDPDAPMASRFGRARGFLLTADEGRSWRFVANPKAEDAHGAGSGTAAFLAEQRVDEVAAVDFGPTASQALDALGIRMWWVPEGLSPRQALERLGEIRPSPERA